MKCPWNCQALYAFSLSSQLNRYLPIMVSSTNVREIVSSPLVWVRSWSWGWISISRGHLSPASADEGWTLQVSNRFPSFRNWNLEITPHSHTSAFDVLPWIFFLKQRQNYKVNIFWTKTKQFQRGLESDLAFMGIPMDKEVIHATSKIEYKRKHQVPYSKCSSRIPK